jgi:prepilin-type N-terminal cleavage/methylation domain-containing protein
MRTVLRRHAAFTLLELVVVVTILVILAAGIIAKLDVFQLRANKGVAASDMAGVSRLMQTYVVANNRYPNGFDSLIDPTTSELWGDSFVGVPVAPQGTLDPQLIAGTSSTHQKLHQTTLTAGEVNSLGRMGVATLYDLDVTSTSLPSNRFSLARAIATGGPVAEINSALNDPSLTTGTDGDADAIMHQLYPQTNGVPPSGTRVLVFGLGPRCDLVGRSGLMQEAPMYANSANKTVYYARDLVCFEVSDGGSRARFLASLGADADRLDEELSEFYEIQ